MNHRLIANIAIPVLLSIVVNVIVFAFRWDSSSRKDTEKVTGLPPGIVIGIIWVCLFGLLGYGRYLLNDSPVAVYAVTFVLVFCILYPFYTMGLSANIALSNTIAMAIIYGAALFVYPASQKAFFTYVPLMCWITYVNMVDALTCKNR